METYVVRVEYPGGRHELRELPPGRYRIGRDTGEIALGDPQASGMHGEIVLGDGRATYTDLGSTNGTTMRGQRLAGTVVVPEQEPIQIGNSSVVLVQVVRKGQTMAATPQRRPPVEVARPAPPPSVVPLVPVLLAGGAGTSHPAAAVRHSYPLAITNASLGTAFGLLMKTLPFMLARLAVLGAYTIAGIIVWAFALAGFWIFRRVPLVGLVWCVLVLGCAGWFWRAVLRYALYLLKAGHIAVLTELVTRGQVGNGQQSMFQYAKEVVKQQFGVVSALFALDILVDGVVGAFNRTLDWVSSLLPVPGLDSVTSVVKAVLRASTTYVDETILSYNLARGDENVFRSSRDGLVYYAQNAREVLKTGVWVVVLDKVLSAVIWVVMLAPAFGLAYFIPNAGGFALVTAFVIAIALAADVRAAFLKPLFLTMVMIKFHTQVQNQPINETWDARLDEVSNRFRELKDKAAAWVAGDQLRHPSGKARAQA
jgi:hypothetical protein